MLSGFPLRLHDNRKYRTVRHNQRNQHAQDIQDIKFIFYFKVIHPGFNRMQNSLHILSQYFYTNIVFHRVQRIPAASVFHFRHISRFAYKKCAHRLSGQTAASLIRLLPSDCDLIASRVYQTFSLLGDQCKITRRKGDTNLFLFPTFQCNRPDSLQLIAGIVSFSFTESDIYLYRFLVPGRYRYSPPLHAPLPAPVFQNL